MPCYSSSQTTLALSSSVKHLKYIVSLTNNALKILLINLNLSICPNVLIYSSCHSPPWPSVSSQILQLLLNLLPAHHYTPPERSPPVCLSPSIACRSLHFTCSLSCCIPYNMKIKDFKLSYPGSNPAPSHDHLHE